MHSVGQLYVTNDTPLHLVVIFHLKLPPKRVLRVNYVSLGDEKGWGGGGFRAMSDTQLVESTQPWLL